MSVISIAPNGRPKKPTAQKKLEGTYRPDRANAAEPKAMVVRIPEPPERLSATEREVWGSTARVVDPMRITAESDLEAFELLVAHLAIVRDARAALRTRGLTYETAAGAIVQRPELQMIATHSKNAMALMSRFGLSPSDRARVSTIGETKTGEVDPLKEFES